MTSAAASAARSLQTLGDRIREANREPATDYSMPEDIAVFLQGMSVLPRDLLRGDDGWQLVQEITHG